MTSGPEQTRALTRREARAIATQHAALLQTSTHERSLTSMLVSVLFLTFFEVIVSAAVAVPPRARKTATVAMTFA